MEHLKWVEIDLCAIRSNLEWTLGRLSAGVKLMAVVKADAYGHGAAAVAKLAAQAGASCLGVLTLEEALDLREAGLREPIVLLAPPLPSHAFAVVRAGVEPTVDNEALLSALAKASRKRLPIHLDIDYGLKRWGLPPKKLPDFLARLKRLKTLSLRGLSTHLDYLPGKNAVEAEDKLRGFQRLAAKVGKEFPGTLCHAANTSILMDFPHRQLDMVRVGNLIYGINPASTPAALKNPWAFKARIISISPVRKGSAVGYGSEYIAPRSMTVAALPVGYADGLTMEPAERLISFGRGFQYWGMLRGRQVPFIGRCGISHVLVDVSGVAQAAVGDAVALPIRRTAASPRLPRLYI